MKTRFDQIHRIAATYIAVLLCLSALHCGRERNPVALPDTHTRGWNQQGSIDFHGIVVLDHGDESCTGCHGEDRDAGSVQVSCIACHQVREDECIPCHGGGDDLSGAPPIGLRGEDSDTSLAVGAHTVHLAGHSVSDGFPCTACHLLPEFVLDPGHLGNGPDDLSVDSDSIAEIIWGDIADAGEATWSRGTATCSQTYCHGGFDGGSSTNTPVWTGGSDEALCGSCHDVGDDPGQLLWEHELHITTAGLVCGDCHANVVDESNTITGPSLHVNGVVDRLTRDEAACEGCHGPGGLTCTACHGGTTNETGAPPVGLEGETATTELAVGAHTLHVTGGAQALGFECSVCHLTPTSAGDPGHLGEDNIAELTFGALAGSSSAWSRSTATCSETYCHGAFSGGAAANTPVWTGGSNEALCGSCHDVGGDPAQLLWEHELHVTTVGLACEDCHANVVDESNTITGLELHVNGVIDTLTRDVTACESCHGPGGLTCTACHGGLIDETGAPPVGLEGETSSTDLAVGAHTQHVTAGSLASAFACTECHVTPVSSGDLDHLGVDSVAELTFGALAGPSSIWSRSTGTCSQTYCHGTFNGGAAANAPVWTGGSDEAVCGSCHDAGEDPGQLLWKHGLHVAAAGLVCGDCHANVVDVSNTIVGVALHVNGVVDTLTRDVALCETCHGPGGMSCAACHGGLVNETGAPPVGLEGETVTTDLAVGAHTLHVAGGSQASAFDCRECHLTPLSTDDPGHLGADSIAELTFGPLAGASASWSRSTATCSATYCHGEFDGGAGAGAPVWTGGSGEAVCGSCHDVGGDPAQLLWEHELHMTTAGLICGDCHANVVDESNTITGLGLHVNGVVDTLTRDVAACESCHGPGGLSCAACHGGLVNETGAPPVGLEGETATTELAVGAHTLHVTGGSQASPFACSECHVTPVSTDDPDHLGEDNIAELTFGTLAGLSSTWSRSTATCSETYCHGAFDGGTSANAPVWTGGSGEAVCGSCHDVGSDPAQLLWEHELHMTTAGLVCGDCHANVVDESNTITDVALHVNGVVDTLTRDVVACESCHGPGGLSCTACHGGLANETGAPPVGLEGETAATELAVGAHVLHIAGGSQASAFACSECHVTPVSTDDPDHLGADDIAELTFGTLAGPSSTWLRSTATCSETYCHGAFSGGSSTNTPVWTGGSDEAACGSCHDVGDDPSALLWEHELHVTAAGLVCGDCHANVVDVSNTITDLALHVNGVVDTLTRDVALCETCHGPGGMSCTACHGGTLNETGAPPVGLEGETSPNQLAIGAHTRHLTGGTQASAFACSQCHVAPVSAGDPGHLGADNIAELTFGSLAGPSSAWSRNTATCSETYCHGEFSGGSSTNTPLWTGGSGQAVCGSCHDVGSNPAQLLWEHELHMTTAGLECGDCHANVVNMSNTITDVTRHVNGVVDTLTRDVAACESCHGPGGLTCTVCHGGVASQTGAPPVGLEGETASSQLAVGAHTLHLTGGTQASAFACSQCHVAPVSAGDPGHLGADEIAELTFGSLAGPSSSWSRSTATCSATYCHGEFAGGSGTNTPLWTGGSGEAVCGSCHDVGSDPAQLLWEHELHMTTVGLECGDCHANVVNMSNTITDVTLHVNGVVDTLTRDVAACESCHGPGGLTCTACHGGLASETGAPPVGLEGETISSQLAVGAHTLHLTGGSQASAFACNQCHLTPVSAGDPGHLGADEIAELTFGSLAGPSSSWSRSTATCSATYCHGEFAGGSSTNTPLWTGGGGEAVCGSCHDVGSDPAQLLWEHELHMTTVGLECGDCHANVVDMSNTITDVTLHVNGVVDTLTRDVAACESCHGPGGLTCTACHGGVANQTGAPPVGLEGETASSQLAVGAHTVHLTGGLQAWGFLCSECHVAPVAIDDPGHLGADEIAELTFGSLAGPSSSWSRSTATCSATYCHGEFLGGSGTNTPVWTGGSGEAVCGSCHDTGVSTETLSGEHKEHFDEGLSCETCHESTVNSSNQIIGIGLHVDGIKTVDFLTQGSYSGEYCSGLGFGCHGVKPWYGSGAGF